MPVTSLVNHAWASLRSYVIYNTLITYRITGSAHKLVSVEDLVAELSKETAELKEKAQQKYEELSSMLKQITMDVADFDTETEETISEIRKARDEQVWATWRTNFTTQPQVYKLY